MVYYYVWPISLEKGVVYKERLDIAWKKVTIDWVDGTMDLAIALWEAREAYKADQDFGKWLEEQGYGEKIISHQTRSALIQIGIPAHREIAKEILTYTSRQSWENVWRFELKLELIDRGLLPRPTGLRNLRNPPKNQIAKIEHNPIIAQPAPERKSPVPSEKEGLKKLNEKEGYKAWFTIEDGPVIGRMPDDTKDKMYEHIREINQRCHELFQLSLYIDQMSDVAKQRLANEFKGIKIWGEALFERMMGHKKFSRLDIPLCHIETPFRKTEQ